MSILDEIFAHKRLEVAAAKQRVPESELQKQAGVTPIPPDFIHALTETHSSTSQRLRSECRPHAPRLIAEVKHRSPSKGVLSPDFNPLRLAHIYAENGAAAISVLTDEKYFGGRLAYLQEIYSFLRDPKRFSENQISLGAINTKEPKHQQSRKKPLGSSIPLLRKDFIFAYYQLLEARVAGASAVLLIVAMLERDTLSDLIAEAKALSLTPLVEVHTRAELDRALDAGASVIGINNRDLRTFKVSLQITLDLRLHIPLEIVVVAESGIKTMDDVARLADAGVDAMLIGEGLVTAEDVRAQVRLFSGLEEGVSYSVFHHA